MKQRHRPRRLAAAYFDGATPGIRPVQIWIESGMLEILGADVIRQIPLGQTSWAACGATGERTAIFRGGGGLRPLHLHAWDEWLRRHGLNKWAHAAQRPTTSHWIAITSTVLLTIGSAGSWLSLPAVGPMLAP